MRVALPWRGVAWVCASQKYWPCAYLGRGAFPPAPAPAPAPISLVTWTVGRLLQSLRAVLHLLLLQPLPSPPPLAPVAPALACSPEALYTGSEAAEVALAYVKAAGLDDPARAQLPDNRTLQLNPLLCDALFKVGWVTA